MMATDRTTTMTFVLSSHQREILEALTRHWELIRWFRPRRWHMGDMAVDGRAVRGLLARGLIEPGGDYAGGQLVLTERGRTALR